MLLNNSRFGDILMKNRPLCVAHITATQNNVKDTQISVQNTGLLLKKTLEVHNVN